MVLAYQGDHKMTICILKSDSYKKPLFLTFFFTCEISSLFGAFSISKVCLLMFTYQNNVKQDRSRRCQNIQSIDTFFTENTCFICKILSNSLSTGPDQWKQRLYLSNSKEIQTFVFWRPFCLFFENAVSYNFHSCQLTLLILNSKQGIEFFF